MPEIGDRVKGTDIGFHSPRLKYIWHACESCGKERWVRLVGGKPINIRCRSCSSMWGSANPQWKGGRVRHGDGYMLIKLSPDDFFRPMGGKRGYVLEHRLVMARSLGRCLQPWEKVHHKNGIKDDNRRSNLELTTLGSHTLLHSKGYRDGYRHGYQDGQSKAIEELTKQIRLLQWQIKEMIKEGERWKSKEMR